MSREPTSSAQVFLHAQAHSPRPEPLSALYEKPPEPPDTSPIPYGKRRFRVTVEPKKQPRRRTRVDDGGGNSPATNRALGRKHTEERQVRAVAKLLSTTEALSAEERKIVRGYRLSQGGPVADAERRKIDREVRRP